MKIYLAIHQDYEDLNIISFHKTKEGAVKALDKHREEKLKNYRGMDISEELVQEWMEGETWEVEEDTLLP